MIKVNLVPPELLARARQRQLIMQASAGGSVMVVVLAIASVIHWAGLFRLQNEYRYDQASLNKLKAVVSQVEDLEKSAAAVHARLDVIVSLVKGRAFYPLFMSEFAKTVPGPVRVTQLTTISQNSSSIKLTINAVAQGSDDIATWMRTLQSDPNFQNVELGAVNGGGIGGQYTFTISAAYSRKL